MLSALASPSEVEVFSDVFYDANGELPKLEASNLWLSQRGDRWRLKIVTEIPGQSELLVSQVTDDMPTIRKELERHGCDLTDVAPVTSPMLTIRAKTTAGVVDVARLPDGTYYPVLAVQEPVPPDGVFDGVDNRPVPPFSARKTPSKLFAFRENSAATAITLWTLTIDELPAAMLCHIPDVPSKVWNRSILSQFLPKSVVSRLCARSPRQSLQKKVISEFGANGIAGVIAALSMDPHAACVKNLAQCLGSKQRGPPRRAVRRWIKLLFDGTFVPCCRGDRFGTRDEEAGTSRLYVDHKGIAVKVFTTAANLVWNPPENVNAEPQFVYDVTEGLDAPPHDTRRFYHGTNVARAYGILTEGIPIKYQSDTSDFGGGFYMASDFKVAADLTVWSGFATAAHTAGHGDCCVLVLDLDNTAYVCVFPSLRTLWLEVWSSHSPLSPRANMNLTRHGMRVCCRYNALRKVQLLGDYWDTYTRMNANDHPTHIKDHPHLQALVGSAEDGIIWGKIADDPAVDAPLEPTEDDQFVLKGKALDGFTDPEFIRQAQLIQWPFVETLGS